MTEEKKINKNNLAIWVAIGSIFSALIIGGKYFSNMAVQINNIGVIDERLDKKIKVINENHEAIDDLRDEMRSSDYELKLEIRDEKIERQAAEIDRLKGK